MENKITFLEILLIEMQTVWYLNTSFYIWSFISDTGSQKNEE